MLIHGAASSTWLKLQIISTRLPAAHCHDRVIERNDAWANRADIRPLVSLIDVHGGSVREQDWFHLLRINESFVRSFLFDYICICRFRFEYSSLLIKFSRFILAFILVLVTSYFVEERLQGYIPTIHSKSALIKVNRYFIQIFIDRYFLHIDTS